MKNLFLLLITFFTVENLIAQTVIVNPDGTHSIVIDNGSTKTIVNPNETHSTVIENGSTKTIVNPNENKQEINKSISSDKIIIYESKNKRMKKICARKSRIVLIVIIFFIVSKITNRFYKKCFCLIKKMTS